MGALKPAGENLLCFQFKDKNGGKRAIDQQLQRAPLLLFRDFIGQNHRVNPSIHFCNSADNEVINFLPESVVVLQRLAIF